MNAKLNHDVKSAIRFLENLYNEIVLSNDIKELQDPAVLKKLKETIKFFEKMLST